MNLTLNDQEIEALQRLLERAPKAAVLNKSSYEQMRDDIRLLQDRIDAAAAAADDLKTSPPLSEVLREWAAIQPRRDTITKLPPFPWCGYCHNTVTEPHSSRNGVPYHTDCLMKEMREMRAYTDS